MSEAEKILVLKRAVQVTGAFGGMDAIHDDETFTSEQLAYLERILNDGEAA